ncbi:unnamed protein product, partial [Didymodactylos carnosus]
QAGIEGARDTMQNNKEWDKHREINAVRWVEAPRRRSPSPSRNHSKYSQKYLHNDRERSGPASCKSRFYDDSQGQSTCLNSHDKIYIDRYSTVTDNRKHGRKATVGDSLSGDYGGRNRQLCNSATSEKINSVASSQSFPSGNVRSCVASYPYNAGGSEYSTVDGGSYYSTVGGGKYYGQESNDWDRQRDRHSSNSVFNNCCGIRDSRGKCS